MTIYNNLAVNSKVHVSMWWWWWWYTYVLSRQGRANFKNCSFLHSPKWLLILIIISAAFYLILNIYFACLLLIIFMPPHRHSFFPIYNIIIMWEEGKWKYTNINCEIFFKKKPNFLSLVSFSVEMFLFFFSFSFCLNFIFF